MSDANKNNNCRPFFSQFAHSRNPSAPIPTPSEVAATIGLVGDPPPADVVNRSRDALHRFVNSVPRQRRTASRPPRGNNGATTPSDPVSNPEDDDDGYGLLLDGVGVVFPRLSERNYYQLLLNWHQSWQGAVIRAKGNHVRHVVM